VIVDTAGRLHTQDDLMAELAKIRRVIERQMADAPHETLLTVDATTGQNGLRQAKLFSEAVPVDGIVLTKLDGTAKGGIALAIAGELGIPVKLIGIGESLEDLRPFDPDDFARALLDVQLGSSSDGPLGVVVDRGRRVRGRRDGDHGLLPRARSPADRSRPRCSRSRAPARRSLSSCSSSSPRCCSCSCARSRAAPHPPAGRDAHRHGGADRALGQSCSSGSPTTRASGA
jgi:hypothetical protein